MFPCARVNMFIASHSSGNGAGCVNEGALKSSCVCINVSILQSEVEKPVQNPITPCPQWDTKDSTC